MNITETKDEVNRILDDLIAELREIKYKIKKYKILQNVSEYDEQVIIKLEKEQSFLEGKIEGINEMKRLIGNIQAGRRSKD